MIMIVVTKRQKDKKYHKNNKKYRGHKGPTWPPQELEQGGLAIGP